MSHTYKYPIDFCEGLADGSKSKTNFRITKKLERQKQHKRKIKAIRSFKKLASLRER